MIFEEMLKEERAAGFAKGRAEGVAEGRISESKDTLLLFYHQPWLFWPGLMVKRNKSMPFRADIQRRAEEFYIL